MEAQRTIQGRMLNGLVEHSRKTPEGLLVNVKVKPNSGRFKLHEDGMLEVKSPPIEGKANAEIMKKLKKMLGCEIKIVYGHSSREKMLLLMGMDAERLNKTLLENK